MDRGARRPKYQTLGDFPGVTAGAPLNSNAVLPVDQMDYLRHGGV
jgi:hypothetical protein